MGFQIGAKSMCANMPPRDHSKRPQDRPQRPPDPPKRLQDGPKRPPRASQEALKETQSLPRPPKWPQLDPEALRGRISPLSNLLSKYAESHSIHHTFIYWKFSRSRQKHPTLFKTSILEPPSFQASLPLSLQVPAAKRLGGIREAQTISFGGLESSIQVKI